MNDILFRAKAINRKEGFEYRTNYKNGDWVYGLITKKFDDKFPILPAEMTNEDGVSGIDVDYKTIGRYTGLKDNKNGTKIFEGDILHIKQCGETGSRISSVYFGEYIDADSVFDNYRCIGFYVKTSDGCCTLGVLLSEEFECEVIGNIYDDQELLEDK